MKYRAVLLLALLAAALGGVMALHPPDRAETPQSLQIAVTEALRWAHYSDISDLQPYRYYWKIRATAPDGAAQELRVDAFAGQVLVSRLER